MLGVDIERVQGTLIGRSEPSDSLTKLDAQVTHTAYLGHARAAPSLPREFGLPLR